MESELFLPRPEAIRRFTQARAGMADPPWLPIAAWVAVVPALSDLGFVSTERGMAPGWAAISLLICAIATVIATRWYRRTYGVVTPRGAIRVSCSPARGFALLVLLTVAISFLEIVSFRSGLQVRLGVLAFAAFLAWGTLAGGGVRKHMFVFAALVGILAFAPTVIADRKFQGAVFSSAFGLGWCFVCVWDYGVVVRTFKQARLGGPDV